MTAVKPVRPPAPTPAALSTKAVIVEVPSNAPALTPIASTVIALPRPGNLPDLGSAIFRLCSSTNQSTHGVEQFYKGEGEDNRD